ncbi:MAG: GNAT family N-acetyltransferase [Actinomycetes bacterium]
MSTPEQHVEFVDNAEAHQYEVRMDGALAGFVTYRLRPGRIEFIHTEVRDEFEGHGLGSRLAAAALDMARDRGWSVTPTCPFIEDFINEHDEYAPLLAS